MNENSQVATPTAEELDAIRKSLQEYIDAGADAQTQGFGDKVGKACAVFGRNKPKLQEMAKLATAFGPDGLIFAAALGVFIVAMDVTCDINDHLADK